MSYKYNATITKVVDGDTVDAVVDLGFYMSFKSRFRLGNYSYDAPELRSKDANEKVRAQEAKEKAKELLLGKTLQIQTYKLDIYGRWSCDITLEDGRDFVTVMKSLGFIKEPKI